MRQSIWLLMMAMFLALLLSGCGNPPTTTFTAKKANTAKSVPPTVKSIKFAKQASGAIDFERPTGNTGKAVKTVWSKTGVTGKTEKVVHIDGGDFDKSKTLVQFEDGDMVMLIEEDLVVVPVGRLVRISASAKDFFGSQRTIGQRTFNSNGVISVKLLD